MSTNTTQQEQGVESDASVTATQGELKAVVHFASPEEVEFLTKSVPRHKAMFKDASFYIVFPSESYAVLTKNEFVSKLEEMDRVHIQFADMPSSPSLLPVDELGLSSMLETFEMVCAQEQLSALDMVMRIPPFTTITNPLFFLTPVASGARMAFSAFDAMPFGPCVYMLSSEYCHCLLRVVSLMGNSMAEGKLADVYIQALAFALFNGNKFFYASKSIPSCRNMQLHYDYDNPEEFKKLLPISGFVSFLRTGKDNAAMMEAFDVVTTAMGNQGEQ